MAISQDSREKTFLWRLRLPKQLGFEGPGIWKKGAKKK